MGSPPQTGLASGNGGARLKCNLCSSEARTKFDLAEFKVLACSRCGLVFLDVLQDAEFLRGLYEEDYYRERKEYYFDNIVADPREGRNNESVQDFAEGLQIIRDLYPQGKSLLDVGCGIGIFLQLARKNGWEVKGVDVAPFAVRYAREMFGLEVHQGPLAKVAFGEGSFDIVTMWDALEHVADPLGELREIGRIAKKGGILILNTPNERSLLRSLAHVLYNMSLRSFRYPMKKLYHRYHLYYFNAFTLTQLVEKAGFRVVTLRRKPIPPVKARGSRLEKAVVKAFSSIERTLGKEYELFMVARKDKGAW